MEATEEELWRVCPQMPSDSSLSANGSAIKTNQTVRPAVGISHFSVQGP